mgnify:CR=1 FL=1
MHSCNLHFLYFLSFWNHSLYLTFLTKYNESDSSLCNINITWFNLYICFNSQLLLSTKLYIESTFTFSSKGLWKPCSCSFLHPLQEDHCFRNHIVKFGNKMQLNYSYQVYNKMTSYSISYLQTGTTISGTKLKRNKL